jgi:DNA-binding CsgD family transcriptional regulator
VASPGNGQSSTPGADKAELLNFSEINAKKAQAMTPSERRTLGVQMKNAGMPTKEIAQRLGVSEQRVHQYQYEAKGKTYRKEQLAAKRKGEAEKAENESPAASSAVAVIDTKRKYRRSDLGGLVNSDDMTELHRRVIAADTFSDVMLTCNAEGDQEGVAIFGILVKRALRGKRT